MTTPHILPLVNDSASRPPTWCHEHLVWECPYIWDLEVIEAPKFLCHYPTEVKHDHPSSDHPSLHLPAGDPSQFVDVVHKRRLESVRTDDPPSLPISGYYRCTKCGGSLLHSQCQAGNPVKDYWVTMDDGKLGFHCPEGGPHEYDPPSQAKSAGIPTPAEVFTKSKCTRANSVDCGCVGGPFPCTFSP